MKELIACYSETNGEGWIMVRPEHCGHLLIRTPIMVEEVRKWCFDANISFKIKIAWAKLQFAGDPWLRSENVMMLHFPVTKDLVLFKLMWNGIIPQPFVEKDSTQY